MGSLNKAALIKTHGASLFGLLAIARQPHHQSDRLVVGEALRSDKQVPRIETECECQRGLQQAVAAEEESPFAAMWPGCASSGRL